MAKILYQPHRGFNKNDCKVESKGSRIEVTVDMIHRYKLAVTALAKRFKASGCPDAETMANDLNKRLKSPTYTKNDFVHVFRMLGKHGIVEFARGAWRLTRHGESIWNNAKKVALN